MSITYNTGQEEKWKNRIVWLHKKVVMMTSKNKFMVLLEGGSYSFLRFNLVTLFPFWCSVCKVSLLPLEGSHGPPVTVALLFTRVPISLNSFHVFTSLVLKRFSE